MENRKTNFMKRAAMFVIAMAVVLTTVLIPVPAKAAAKDAFVVSSYTMAKFSLSTSTQAVKSASTLS